MSCSVCASAGRHHLAGQHTWGTGKGRAQAACRPAQPSSSTGAGLEVAAGAGLAQTPALRFVGHMLGGTPAVPVGAGGLPAQGCLLHRQVCGSGDACGNVVGQGSCHPPLPVCLVQCRAGG